LSGAVERLAGMVWLVGGGDVNGMWLPALVVLLGNGPTVEAVAAVVLHARGLARDDEAMRVTTGVGVVFGSGGQR
jgi:hypothetical protein